MPLTVLSFAFPFAPVGPQAVGGSEQVLTALDHALVAAGHTSLVVACEGSSAAGKLLAVPRLFRMEDEHARRWCRKQVQACLDRVLAMYPVDLIHMHSLEFHEYTLPPEIPVLVTLHLPISWYPQQIWKKLPSNVHLQCVSETQHRSFPPELGEIPVIPNGVEIPPLTPKSGQFAIVLGRICPEKNQHLALEAGFRAGVPIVLGGQVFPWRNHLAYFHEKIEPLLRENRNGITHKFLGPLPPGRKHRLLSQAKCLLHPTLAPETSSLVAMEALAAGTPVIAFPSGALTEIVQHGVTGFFVDSLETMVEALHHTDTFRPQVCRDAAIQHFSRTRMVRQYFDLYGSLVQAHSRQKLYA